MEQLDAHQGNMAEEVARLKLGPGGDILLPASAELMQTLMEQDLVDEYRLRVAPIVVGRGKRLFADAGDARTLGLVGTKTFGSGAGLTFQSVGNQP